MQPNLYAVSVDLILITVFALTVYRAWKRGFVNAVAGLLSVVGAVIIANMFSFILDGFLQRTVFDPLVHDIIGGVVRDAVMGVSDTAASVSDAAAQALSASLAGIRSWTDAFGIALPLDAQSLSSHFTGEIDAAVMDGVTAEIAAPIAARLASWSAALILFAIAYFALRAVFAIVDLVARLPLLHEANSTLGCICGILLGAGYAFVTARVLSLILGILAARGTLPPELLDGVIFGWLAGVTSA